MNRRVSLGLRLQLLLADGYNLLGWLFILFSLAGFHNSHSDLFHVGPYPHHARGRVTHSLWQGKQMNVGVHFLDDKGDDRDVYGGFTRGQAPQQGAEADVEYDTTHARIVGSQWSNEDSWLVVMCVLGLIGIGLICEAFREARRNLLLLRRGKQATGSLVKSRELPIRLNKVYSPWLVTYQFVVTETGELANSTTVVVRTEPPEAEAQLLYDPEYPKRAALCRDIPGKPMLAENGTILAKHVWLRTFAAVSLVVLAAVMMALLAVGTHLKL